MVHDWPDRRTAKVWDCDSGECVQTLRGHADRLAKLAFHPGGRYLGTASFDHTWRLWDLETGEELLLQVCCVLHVYTTFVVYVIFFFLFFSSFEKDDFFFQNIVSLRTVNFTS